jgi:oligopeptide transport system substrate-binding protein
MALWVTYPVKEEILDEGGEDWWINPQYHVGNGPYIMTELEPNVRARFEPSPSYHRGLGKVAIEFSYITESAVAFQAYRNDEFDIVTTAVEDLETIKADPELSKEYLEYAGSCTMGFIFHRGKEPFNDPKVRQAFSMALDRESYVRDVRSGLGLPTLTWIPDGMPGHQAGEQRWGYDPEAARKALAESSYGGPENLPKVVDSYPDTSRMRLRHEWLAAQWKQVLGVDVELDPVEPTSYAALTKDKSTAPQLFLLGWCADYPDPQTWLSSFWKTGAHAYEMVGFSDPDLDALLEKADSTLDRERRMELYDEAQDLIIDDCPGAFMFHTVQAFLVKPWVKGCKPNPLDFDWPGSFEPLSIEIDASLKPQ